MYKYGVCFPLKKLQHAEIICLSPTPCLHLQITLGMLSDLMVHWRMPQNLSSPMMLMIQYCFLLAAPLHPFQFLPAGVHQPQWLLQYVGPPTLFTHVAAILKKMTMQSGVWPPRARPQVSNARQQAPSSILVPRARPSTWSVMMTTIVRVMVGLCHHPLQKLRQTTMGLWMPWLMPTIRYMLWCLHFLILTHLNLRLQSQNLRRSVLLPYTSCSTMRINMSIQSLASVWMVTGAISASNYTPSLFLVIY